jgi:NAD(P)-dependent dehydrogenase (short-subunit alcohol dehydrogenase family)
MDGGDAVGRVADVTDPGDVAELVDVTVDAFGGLDHVVTSAGGVPSGGFDGTTDEQWYDAYDTLVMSHVWTLREAKPHLLESDAGSAVSITSTSVREPIDDLVLSNSVRRAVLGTVKTLSREWAPRIRVNAVLPSTLETGRIEDLIEQGIERGDYDSYEEGRADWGDPIPLGRIGDPMELGDAVAFLASERASFVTGAALPVDGGRLHS